MTINWRTTATSPSVINYGLTQGNLNLSASTAGMATDHSVKITGLSPNTVYYYEIPNAASTNVNLAANLYFKTYPIPGSFSPMRAWVLGDCGTADINQRQVRNAYVNSSLGMHTDMILLLGDNAYWDGTQSEHQFALFENMYEETLKNTVTWSCYGNHDGTIAGGTTQSGPYFDIFTFPTAGESGGVASGTEAYYSYDFANVHFIVLDSWSSSRTVGGVQYNWALNDIQNTTQDWIVVYFHHPAYHYQRSDVIAEEIEMRENFLPMLENNGIDLVLSGHAHSYERSYLIKDHYGMSSTFDSATHIMGGNSNGAGDGKVDGDGAYCKPYETKNKGTVYITLGSSGKVTGTALGHPVFYANQLKLGSGLLEVDGYEMDFTFIDVNQNASDYFSIHKTPINLPADYINLYSKVEDKGIRVHWGTEENEQFDYYEVQRSVNGLDHFETIHKEQANARDGKFEYDAVDEDIEVGNTYYYRIQQYDIDGASVYSKVISNRILVPPVHGINLGPNPVQAGRRLQLIVDDEAEIAAVMLYNSNGQLIHSYNLSSSLQEIEIPNISVGNYYLGVRFTDKTKVVKQLLIE